MAVEGAHAIAMRHRHQVAEAARPPTGPGDAAAPGARYRCPHGRGEVQAGVERRATRPEAIADRRRDGTREEERRAGTRTNQPPDRGRAGHTVTGKAGPA